ncbi:uncharacterized protein TEOVI_000267400 [Trypanosoma equiperdum]|uniref:Uncharacterized protein n=1 Tax=Trypanosoma equiperdum TaxID=5694 RepID=A0A1G4IFK4_TRYEQ|nr:hypothetical protein, conserved [Trypanosoma equiperdum]
MDTAAEMYAMREKSQANKNGGDMAETTLGRKCPFAPSDISPFVAMALQDHSAVWDISDVKSPLRRAPAKRKRTESIGKDMNSSVKMEMTTNTVATMAYLLQSGSPLYDPVEKLWRCWNGHELCIKRISDYSGAEEVTCDFCGVTHWCKNKEVRAKPHRLKKLPPEGLLPAEAEPVDETYLYNCSECGMDLCAHCASEVYQDERYHVPCMQCVQCKLFMHDTDGMLHRCQVKRTRVSPSVLHKSPTSTSGCVSSSIQMDSTGSCGVSVGREQSITTQLLPSDVWEVCVAAKNAEEEVRARALATTLFVKETYVPDTVKQLTFRMPTRLAAEELARRGRDAGLCTAVRKSFV